MQRWRGREVPKRHGLRSECGSRIAILREFQRRLHERKSEIAEAITREAGKPVAEALTTEVLVVLDAARFLIDHAYRLLRDEPVASWQSCN